MNKEDLNWGEDDLCDIFNLLLIVVRYPEKINIVPENILEQYAELFNKIYKILDFKGILSHKENLFCTRATVSAAIAIFNLLNISEKEDNKNESENDNKEDSGNGKRHISIAIESLDGSCISGTNIINIDSSSEIFDNRQEQEMEKQLIYDDVAKDDTFGWGHGLGVNNQIKELKKSNVLAYNKFYGDIKKFISDFQKIIVPVGSDDIMKKVNMQRSGQLDPNKIIDALQGGKFGHTRMETKEVKNKPKYALVLNIDESSSMCGNMSEKKSRTAKTSPVGIASRLAVLFYEAMKDYKDLEIYIYGHGDNINRYIFKDKLKNKYVLGWRQIQGGQHDSKSIDIILNEVRNNTQLPIIMVNITDSLYLVGVSDMKSIVDKYGDVAFTLMCVDQVSKRYLTEEHIKINDTIYGKGQWVCVNDKTNLKNIAVQLAKAFRNNFKRRDK